MSTSNGNFIRPGKHGSQVVLDPDYLLCHPLYMPDGQSMSKSNMTLGQAIEAIALAHIRIKMPHLAEKCNAATIEFKDGKFVVCFADNIDNLSF